MLTSVDVKFIFDSACLWASLGDKGLFAANILRIADSVFFFFLSSCCSCYVFRQEFAYFFHVKEWNVPLFCIFKTTQTTQPRPQVFNNLAILLYDWRHQFTHRKILPHLVDSGWLWNYAWDFSQSGACFSKVPVTFRTRKTVLYLLCFHSRPKFQNFENNTMKLSANEIKLNGLWARNCATTQQVLILKICLRAQKASGSFENGEIFWMNNKSYSRSFRAPLIPRHSVMLLSL